MCVWACLCVYDRCELDIAVMQEEIELKKDYIYSTLHTTQSPGPLPPISFICLQPPWFNHTSSFPLSLFPLSLSSLSLFLSIQSLTHKLFTIDVGVCVCVYSLYVCVSNWCIEPRQCLGNDLISGFSAYSKYISIDLVSYAWVWVSLSEYWSITSEVWKLKRTLPWHWQDSHWHQPWAAPCGGRAAFMTLKTLQSITCSLQLPPRLWSMRNKAHRHTHAQKHTHPWHNSRRAGVWPHFHTKSPTRTQAGTHACSHTVQSYSCTHSHLRHNTSSLAFL